MFAINRNIQNVLVVKSVVGGSKSNAAVFADLYAFALGSEDYSLRIFRIDQDRIHDPIAGRGALPFAAFVGGLPESARGARIKCVRMLRVLLNQLSTAKNKWDAAVA